ncbi:hypothetical protein Y032_0052g2247 [Ancylostoma ceylanicum]|uniref:Potassium channel domain-containing protein n=1 Tax=Ancylostoma ceylanicum TaxID=53326 RepID=A0A016U896_9BILA|nr:hypothetical protein Y032_0052g2247 [Ancylostoma ceylanicum]
MFLVERLRSQLSEASTVAVHIILIVGVTFYTLFGAVVMQQLESPDTVKAQNKREVDDKAPDVFTRVYLGSEISALDPGVHECLEHALEDVMERTKCDDHELEHLSIARFDDCYQNAKLAPDLIRPTKPVPTVEEEISAELEKWSFGNSLIFAFTVITTIGYGHVAPETFYGRLFCIVYGLIGVPLTLLTIADLGMFLAILLRKATNFIYSAAQCCSRSLYKNGEKDGMLSTARDLKLGEDDEEEEKKDENEPRKTGEAVALGLTFSIYLLVGAKVLSVYEPEMDFFKAFYFNFVTLTTIGYDYLMVTLCYIGVGLALTTMAIELAADLLRKLHYVGRKMDNMANVVVWFGGKKMTMKRLVKNLGDQFNIPEEEMANFNLNEFVESAIKVEAGEIKTLRKPVPSVLFRDDGALSYSKLRKSSESDIRFADERFSRNRGPPTCEVRQRLVRVSPDFTMTAGDRHMDKVKEETSDERGDELRLAAIHGAVTWRSIRIISTTHDFELAKSEDTLM